MESGGGVGASGSQYSIHLEQRQRLDLQQTADNGTLCEEIASRHLVGDLPAKVLIRAEIEG